MEEKTAFLPPIHYFFCFLGRSFYASRMFMRKHFRFNFASCTPLTFEVTLQLSFQMWTNQIQETLNSKKHGDVAFRAKDFATAIESYTEVRHSSEIQTLIVRHKLCYQDMADR